MAEVVSFAERARSWAFFSSWRLRERLVRMIVPRREVLVRGLRLTLPCQNWITSYRWRTYASKEPETLDWLDRLPPDAVLFDIGANIGLYSLYAAKRHPSMRVAAFEPEYSNLHLLRDNVIENGVSAQVTIFGAAIGRSSGVSYLHVQDLQPGAALHSVSADTIVATRTDRPVVGREGIIVLSLDDFCAQTGLMPSCMKVDVDGYEIEVLEGATETLGRPEFTSLLMEMPEVADEYEACRRLLEDAGLRRVWYDAARAGYNEVWERAQA